MRIGAVVIGRNEGERLRRCLASVVGGAAGVHPVVYVDSASTDGSVEAARRVGADVVELDLSVPFTAARARNAGFERLRAVAPEVELVQFVDGDCELFPEFVARAARTLDDATVVAVAGRLRERDVEASVYNRLCDVEWDGPAGDVDFVGGIAMYRASAFAAAAGFDPALIAGEEPELCLRLRRAGGRIVRIADDMALHDAAMTRFSQWWTRARRAGHAYAEGAAMHGDEPERHFVRETRRLLFWGAALPVGAVLGAPLTFGLSLGLFGLYPVSAYRAYRSVRGRRDARDALTYAAFTTLGKWPEAIGALSYGVDRLRGRRRGLIEYK